MSETYSVKPSGRAGIYNCGKYQIRHSDDAGGKAGRGKNKTATLQVTLSDIPGGYLVKKMFSFKVCDKRSYDRAEAKCIEWIKEHP